MRIIVFDTETIGKITQDLLNVGWMVVDLNIQQATTTILAKHDYIITENFNNKQWCINDDFVGLGKWEQMALNIKNKKSVKRKLSSIMATLSKDLQTYNVLFGYAYNCQFDIDIINSNCERNGVVNPLENLPIFDIWGYATNFICNTPDYQEWAKNNNILTATERFIATSVEAVARYLYQDVDFREEHLALSDVGHELTILCECVRRGVDITRPIARRNNVESGKVFHACIVQPNGEQVEFDYSKSYSRGDKIFYK